MKLKSVLAHTLAVFLVSMFSLPTLAQNFRGQVRGLVSETSGAVVPAANVTLANVSTGVTTAKQTDTAGVYIFDFVDPGTVIASEQVATSLIVHCPHDGSMG